VRAQGGPVGAALQRRAETSPQRGDGGGGLGLSLRHDSASDQTALQLAGAAPPPQARPRPQANCRCAGLLRPWTVGRGRVMLGDRLLAFMPASTGTRQAAQCAMGPHEHSMSERASCGGKPLHAAKWGPWRAMRGEAPIHTSQHLRSLVWHAGRPTMIQ